MKKEIFHGQDLPENEINKHFRNLAVGMDSRHLASIENELSEGYDHDTDSVQRLTKKRIAIQGLMNLDAKPKTKPWPGAANVKVSTLQRAVTSFASEASRSLFLRPNASQVRPLNQDPETVAKARLVKDFYNNELNNVLPRYFDGWDKTFSLLATEGTAVRKIFYDTTIGSVNSAFILPSDFLVNYTARSISEADRVTNIIRYSEDEIHGLIKSKFFTPFDPDTSDQSPEEDRVQKRVKRMQGVSDTGASDIDGKQVILEIHTRIKVNPEDMIKTPVIVWMTEIGRKIIRIHNRFHPKTKEVLNFFVSMNFFENPYSFYGIGLGELLFANTSLISSLLNILTDSGVSSILPTGFIAKGAFDAKKGSLAFRPNEYKEINLRGSDDIRKNLMQNNYNPPSQVILSAIQMLMGDVNQLVGQSNITSGNLPSSSKTGAVSIALEEAKKSVNHVFAKIHRSIREEMKMHFTLYGLHLDRNRVIDIGGQTRVIAKDLFDQPLDISPVSDPRIFSDQEEQLKAQAMQGVIQTNPFLAQSPTAHAILTKAILKSSNVDDATVNTLIQEMQNMIQKQQEQAAAQAEQEQAVAEQSQRAEQEGALAAEQEAEAQRMAELEAELE